MHQIIFFTRNHMDRVPIESTFFILYIDIDYGEKRTY